MVSGGASRARVTSAVRTPMFWRTRGLIVTVDASPPASAYTGSSIMFMNGDLPGLSKRWPGTIGSCQYSTLRPVAGSTSPGFCGAPVFGAAGAPAVAASIAAGGASRRPSQ